MSWVNIALREDFIFKQQKRRDQAANKQTMKDVAAFDFETSHGNVVITSYSYHNGDKWVGEAYDHRESPFTIKFCMGMVWKSGRVHTRTEKKKRVNRLAIPKNVYAWNLGFEQGSMLKTLPAETVDILRRDVGCVIDLDTGVVEADIYKDNGQWKRHSGGRINRNKYVAIFYIPKKMLKLEPIFFRGKVGDKTDVRMPKIQFMDIAQFYGGSLDNAANDVLGEGKVDNIDREQLGKNDPDHAYWTDNWENIWEYAIKDSVLTAKLAWLKVQGFEKHGVRMAKPISCAFVAEQSVYDLCDLPTMNKMWKSMPDNIKRAWTAYQGGWFEATGAGYSEDVRAYDLASAYPHVMWWLPDYNGGIWMDSSKAKTAEKSKKMLFSYLDNTHKLYRICFVSAKVMFPKGETVYPAAKGRKADGTKTATVMNPRSTEGWFTGDEINEFRKWGAKIVVGEWFYHKPKNDHDTTKNDVGEDGVRYPLRPFIQTFYGMKLEHAKKRDECPDCSSQVKCTQDECEFDKDAYNVSKVMINSIYGKLMSMVEDKALKMGRTGNLWNSMWASITTAGCRMRLAEFARINGTETVMSLATDGIILNCDATVPENPAPVFFDDERVNLGDWEDDGTGNLLLLMSGVYSIIKPPKADGTVPSKSTYRGNYALFIGRQYPDNWWDFCKTYDEETQVVRDEDNNPYSRPYSVGEAGVRKDYSLINDFRVVRQTVRAMGDSNKRSWHNCNKPTTFGDLTSDWYVSNPHRRMN
jgi:hypothetical protein